MVGLGRTTLLHLPGGSAMSEVIAPSETDIDVFLLYQNEVDSYSGRSIFKSVHGSLEQAKDEIPDFARKYEKEPRRDLYGPEYVVDYMYYTIKQATISVALPD